MISLFQHLRFPIYWHEVFPNYGLIFFVRSVSLPCIHTCTHIQAYTQIHSVFIYLQFDFFPHAPLWVSLEFSSSCCWVEKCLMEKGMKFAFQDPPCSGPEQHSMLYTVCHPLLAFCAHVFVSACKFYWWEWMHEGKSASATKYKFSPT